MSSFLQFCGAQSLHPQHAKVWGFKRNWRSALHLKLWAACLKYLLLLGFIFYEKVTYMLLLLLWVSGDTVLPFSSLLSIQTSFLSFVNIDIYVKKSIYLRYTMSQCDFTTKWISRKKFVPTSVRLAIWSQKERIRMGILKTIREIIRYV